MHERGTVCDFCHDEDRTRYRWRACRRKPVYSWVNGAWGVLYGCRRTDPYFQRTTIFRADRKIAQRVEDAIGRTSPVRRRVAAMAIGGLVELISGVVRVDGRGI